MKLRSCVMTIKEFLSLHIETSNNCDFFLKGTDHYTIPLYQREYKWSGIRVEQLIRDIKNNDKLLGIVILNRNDKKDSYDIVDGQQRITTMILILAALFNHAKKEESTKPCPDQEDILEYIQRPDTGLRLENESIGSWLKLEENEMVVTINQEDDVYHQKEIFEKHWNQINHILDQEQIVGRKFLDHCLDCEILVLSCDALNRADSPEHILWISMIKKRQWIRKIFLKAIALRFVFRNIMKN